MIHYHVTLRHDSGQVSVLTGQHTFRTEAPALAAARRLVVPGARMRVVHDNTTRVARLDGSHVYVTACENPLCLAQSDTRSVGQKHVLSKAGTRKTGPDRDQRRSHGS